MKDHTNELVCKTRTIGAEASRFVESIAGATCAGVGAVTSKAHDSGLRVLMMSRLFDRLRTQFRLLTHGCDHCGRRLTTTEDGYLCDACDDEWCEVVGRVSEGER